MRHRSQTKTDSTDLIIAGVEISLWVAEQFAADLRGIFPQLNIVTVSANKLLGLGDSGSAGKVFFPGADHVLTRRIDEYTCALLISQSGQTFPTLHATRRVASLICERTFLMTGCFNSKMEQALVESYQERGLKYGRNRVFNNYSGNRPAEPSSCAIVATFHSLTHLLLHLITVTRSNFSGCRIIHKWTYEKAINVIVMALRRRHFWYRVHLRERAKNSVADANQIKLQIEEDRKQLESRSSEDIEKEKSDKRAAIEQSLYKGHTVLMNLTDGCIKDIKNLLRTAVLPNVISIVGYDEEGYPLQPYEKEVNESLIQQGKRWGDHINEPWNVLVYVGCFIIATVGCGLTPFSVLATICKEIIKASTNVVDKGDTNTISASPQHPYNFVDQPALWSIFGVIVQMCDAVLYIYIGKLITWGCRWLDSRPMHARMGKRTIVVVDTPCVHQLTEAFVSKLYAQGYSYRGVDVHGASGLDHFVHRFTHRVARGVLIAVGRPDGRLLCLAKSEAGVILAAKQAAFIQNPAHVGDGSGPDFITLGHNPFKPNLGLCHNVVLDSSTRRKFIDEFIYERLHLASNPFTGALLRAVERAYKEQTTDSEYDNSEDAPPYGAHHINPSIETGDLFSSFIIYAQESGMLTKKNLDALASDSEDEDEEEDEDGEVVKKAKKVKVIAKPSDDPNVRLAFASRLDSDSMFAINGTNQLQQFYESRVASLHRYVGFCVMFHAMAKHTRDPYLKVAWDMARQQSNLRVATTAAPIAASEAGGHHISKETKSMMRKLGGFLKGFTPNF